jgi:Zn-finger nucleic acid-binding protein
MRARRVAPNLRSRPVWDVGVPFRRRSKSARAAWTNGGTVDLACPRCGGAALRRVALDVATVHVEQCARCLGSFVRTHDFSEFLAREEAGEAVGLRHFVPLAPGRELPRQALLALVRCPHCRKDMERVRFAGRASLLVDVCPAHGMWLDAGEVVSLVTFVKQRASGAASPDPVEQEEEQMWAKVDARMAAEAKVIEQHTRRAELELRRSYEQRMYGSTDGGEGAIFVHLFAALRDRRR